MRVTNNLKEIKRNIVIKKSNKYNYIQGKQLTDPGSGTRVYDIVGTRLPSVTTVLGATKNQDFIKKWKAKVGEQEADRIKNHSSNRGTGNKLCYNASRRNNTIWRYRWCK